MGIGLELALILVGNCLVALVFGVLGGYIWNKGVLGVARRLDLRIGNLEGEISDLSTRMTRFNRQRAADASIEARGEAKSLKDEALELLNHPPAQRVAKGRPSVINFRR